MSSTYYFSPVGNDSTGNGTSGNPWQTLSKAVSSSASGDTLLADSANGNNTFSNQLFATTRTVGSYGGSVAVFDGAAADVVWIYNVVLTLNGIKIQNADTPSGIFQSSNVSGTTFNAIGCYFTNLTSGDGIFIDYNVTTFNITSCVLYLNILRAASNFKGYFSAVNGTTRFNVTNCTFYDTNTSATALHITMGAVLNATNSIFYQSNVINFDTSGSTITLTNCDVFGYTNPGGTNIITSDPLFVDAANGNFNLRRASPCIDTGTAI